MIQAKEYSITVRLSKDQLEKLVVMSDTNKVSRAEIIRQGLERMFKNEDRYDTSRIY